MLFMLHLFLCFIVRRILRFRKLCYVYSDDTQFVCIVPVNNANVSTTPMADPRLRIKRSEFDGHLVCANLCAHCVSKNTLDVLYIYMFGIAFCYDWRTGEWVCLLRNLPGYIASI
jgi:hypothetical protein